MTSPRNTWTGIKSKYKEGGAGQLGGVGLATKELVTFCLLQRPSKQEGVRCRRDNREL
jgi:hypothetical protein